MACRGCTRATCSFSATVSDHGAVEPAQDRHAATAGQGGCVRAAGGCPRHPGTGVGFREQQQAQRLPRARPHAPHRVPLRRQHPGLASFARPAVVGCVAPAPRTDPAPGGGVLRLRERGLPARDAGTHAAGGAVALDLVHAVLEGLGDEEIIELRARRAEGHVHQTAAVGPGGCQRVRAAAVVRSQSQPAAGAGHGPARGWW